jgi:hypothetical protein
VIEAAVGDVDGKVDFNIAVVGANSIVARPDVKYNPAPIVRADIVALDTWSAHHSLGKVDFIKIDVEGYEPQVLCGAAELLCRARPPVLMEFNSVAIAFEARESPVVFAERLWKLFEVFHVSQDGTLRAAGNGAVHQFVTENMVKHGCVDDVLIRPRPHVDATSIRQGFSR